MKHLKRITQKTEEGFSFVQDFLIESIDVKKKKKNNTALHLKLIIKMIYVCIFMHILQTNLQLY